MYDTGRGMGATFRGIGIHKLMTSRFQEPVNLGQDRMVSINTLAHMIAAIAGIDIRLKHVPGPQGVRGRNSDNSLLREILNWEPEVSLENGLLKTYAWIESQLLTRAYHGSGATLAEAGVQPLNL